MTANHKKIKQMIKQINNISGLLIILILLTSWSPDNIQRSAFVSISMTTHGAMQKGYGIIMTLKNIESNESFKSESLGPISPHSMFKNLKPGKYVVSKIEIPLGSTTYINQSKEMSDFFGVLEFEQGKAYYLGNFIGNRETGRQNVFHLKLDKPDIHDKLLKKLKKKKIELDKNDLIRTFPYSKNVLTIY
ncbi:hypothetical protein [Saccharicrinis sp. FJH54]|uniref:hypothetical protein n=1 Tax=Saccharicrinis sp. FJH54 TaxID=3344665 RepID=UPI0035D45A11